MSQSFYTGTDGEIYAGSNSFSTLISAQPTDYGLVAADATAYAALNATYAAAYLANKSVATRNHGTTLAKNDARLALVQRARLLAAKINGTPTVTDQQKADLGLAVRGIPGPRPAPGKPYDFKVGLNGNGAIDITWKSKGTIGTVYQVWRRVGTETEFTYLGGVGQKKFTDDSIPSGSTQVTYQIQAVRSTGAGQWAQLNVNFGMPGPGGVSAVESTPTKLAA